jgi:hypothetical protein
MAMRAFAICLAFYGWAASAAADSDPETWMPLSPNARAVTGRVTFAPNQIAFENGKSLPLAQSGQMLVRPEPKKKKVVADLYRVTAPDDTIPLCKGKPAVYLLVLKPEKVGNEVDPRTLAAFSGPKLNAGSTDDCGRYLYDARAN